MSTCQLDEVFYAQLRLQSAVYGEREQTRTALDKQVYLFRCDHHFCVLGRFICVITRHIAGECVRVNDRRNAHGYDRDAERFSAYLGAGIADSRAGDYSAVRYLNCAPEPAELARGECIDDYHGAGLYHIHRAEQQLACFDSCLTEHSGCYRSDRAQPAEPQLLA